MQSDKSTESGAPTHRRGREGQAGEAFSPAEAERMARGQELKRYVRAAAALHGLYDDTALGNAVGRTRIAVGKWWRGAQPEPPALIAIARVTGLSADELLRFVYNDGPPPSLSPLASGVAEGIRRDQERQPLEGRGARVPLPGRRPRGSGAGHG